MANCRRSRGVGQRIQVSFMLQKRTLTPAVRQLSPEKRSSIVPARRTDTENFQRLLIQCHPRNAFLAIEVELHQLFKIDFSVSA